MARVPRGRQVVAVLKKVFLNIISKIFEFVKFAHIGPGLGKTGVKLSKSCGSRPYAVVARLCEVGRVQELQNEAI